MNANELYISFFFPPSDYVSGLTLSGGDPLFPGNRSAIDALVREVKEKYPCKVLRRITHYLTPDSYRCLCPCGQDPTLHPE